VATLILDQFTDTNGVDLTAHTVAPTNTPAASWVNQLTDPIVVSSNKASAAVGSGAQKVYTIECGQSNVTVSAVFNIGTTSGLQIASLMLRYAGSGDYNSGGAYWMITAWYDNNLILYEADGVGGLTQRASGTWSADTFDHTLTFSANGTALSANVDGGTPVTYTSSALQSNTKVGIRPFGNTATVTYDDFTVDGTAGGGVFSWANYYYRNVAGLGA